MTEQFEWVTYSGSQQYLQDVGCDSRDVETLCQGGVPARLFDVIDARATLEKDHGGIVFARHEHLGDICLDLATRAVRFVGGDPETQFINSNLQRYVETVRLLYRVVPDLQGMDDLDDLAVVASRVAAEFAKIDLAGMAPGMFWDTVRESISIGDWSV